MNTTDTTATPLQSDRMDGIDQFRHRFAEVQKLAHGINVKNGWWEKRERIQEILSQHGIENRPNLVIELLGLAGTEIAEAIEAARKHPPEQWGDFKTKDTFVRECAGTVVRLMDLCEALKLDLGTAIIAEMDANIGRGIRHGGKAA